MIHNSQVALLHWDETDGIVEVIGDELVHLGYTPVLVHATHQIPRESSFLFTYGPYGPLMPFLSQLDDIPQSQRPISVHWNTEGVPDLRLPWKLVQAVGIQRSWAEQFLQEAAPPWLRRVSQGPLLRPFAYGMKRFRYVGDLYRARQRGWVNVVADSSQIYAKRRSDYGLPTLFAPWGVTGKWYKEMNVKRDIDVLWMGNRSTRRRAKILDSLRDTLRAEGVRVYMADNVESPFIYGDERTELLNRAKITLNITRTWFDDNFSRFALTGPNRSMIVSETLLPHCPYFEPGTHYAAAPVAQLAAAILYYLEHDEARQRIVENCYDLMTSKLTMRDSIQRIMEAAESEARRVKCET